MSESALAGSQHRRPLPRLLSLLYSVVQGRLLGPVAQVETSPSLGPSPWAMQPFLLSICLTNEEHSLCPGARECACPQPLRGARHLLAYQLKL